MPTKQFHEQLSRISGVKNTSFEKVYQFFSVQAETVAANEALIGEVVAVAEHFDGLEKEQLFVNEREWPAMVGLALTESKGKKYTNLSVASKSGINSLVGAMLRNSVTEELPGWTEGDPMRLADRVDTFLTKKHLRAHPVIR